MSSSKANQAMLTVRLAELEDGPRVARRIILHADVLKAMRVFAGDVVRVVAAGDKLALGVAWPAHDARSDSVQLSLSLLHTLGVQDGARVVVSPANSYKTKNATSVVLRELDAKPDIEEKKKDWLVLQLRETLIDLKYISPSQAVAIQHGGRERIFFVQTVSDAVEDVDALASRLNTLSIAPRKDVWTVSWDTNMQLLDPPKSEPETIDEDDDEGAYAAVGGLDAQIRAVRDLIDIPLRHPELFASFALSPPRGLLLFGPPGTGKTHLARAIAHAARASVIVVNGPELVGAYHGETEGRLRGVFAEAREKSPCVVVLDEVDALCPRREDAGEAERRTVATLLTLMDGMDSKEHRGARVVVVATTNRPNALDPALRRPGRFDREIEIGVPNAAARRHILQVLLVKTPHTLTSEYLSRLADSLHGFVGADLGALVRSAGTLAIARRSRTLDEADITAALPGVRPSALREVEVQSAGVGARWADVGGMQRIRGVLEQAVVWPLLHRAAFARLGAQSPRGVLLYGPPGCSKTLLARALAGESGVNFVAVRGAEVMNKYVGESERAVRDVFRKARAASPCVVFFDEIDALGTTRSEDGATHVGVLTTLLNEMDGVQAHAGAGVVVVVAATNRPQVLDSALMRPGRLDRVLFVGPPDEGARVEILRVHTRNMTCDPALDLRAVASLTDGCSGAELAATCQDAALRALARDIDAPFVSEADFVAAARDARRGITKEILDEYEVWRRSAGVPAL